MAEILLASLTGPSAFERPVVLKRILPHLAENETFVSMFLDEARIAAGIRHPKVVQVQELVHAGGELFLVLEYVEGESVGGIMRRLWSHGEKLDYALAAHIIAEACSGLHAAHELRDPDGSPREVVHRDVSPQNVMVTYAGEVKVLDFGIAKAADRATRTETGQLKGKFEYMSPEQCRGKPLDRRSDIFSLGILLYELSVGRRLFRRADAPLATFQAICESPIPSPRETCSDYPEDLEAVCRKALARRPEDRYATALEMRRDLALVVRRLGRDEPEEEALSRLLQRLFADRIQEKLEMLQRLRAGSNPTYIPEAEVDAAVEIPNVPETLVTEPVTRVRARSGRRVAFAAGVGVAGAVAVAVVAVAFARARVAASSPPAASNPVAVAPAPSAPLAPSSVSLLVESTPPGARVVVDGREAGTTPASIELPRGAEAVALEVSSAGYLTLSERVVPDADQHLILQLQPVPPPAASSAAAPTKRGSRPAPARASTRPSAPAPTPSPAPTPAKIERFD
jgi:serine/threonine-protein kinase